MPSLKSSLVIFSFMMSFSFCFLLFLANRINPITIDTISAIIKIAILVVYSVPFPLFMDRIGSMIYLIMPVALITIIGRDNLISFGNIFTTIFSSKYDSIMKYISVVIDDTKHEYNEKSKMKHIQNNMEGALFLIVVLFFVIA